MDCFDVTHQNFMKISLLELFCFFCIQMGFSQILHSSSVQSDLKYCTEDLHCIFFVNTILLFYSIVHYNRFLKAEFSSREAADGGPELEMLCVTFITAGRLMYGDSVEQMERRRPELKLSISHASLQQRSSLWRCLYGQVSLYEVCSEDPPRSDDHPGWEFDTG